MNATNFTTMPTDAEPEVVASAIYDSVGSTNPKVLAALAALLSFVTVTAKGVRGKRINIFAHTESGKWLSCNLIGDEPVQYTMRDAKMLLETHSCAFKDVRIEYA